MKTYGGGRIKPVTFSISALDAAPHSPTPQFSQRERVPCTQTNP